MKLRLMRYYFLFVVLTLALFSFENNGLKKQTSRDVNPVDEELRRRPIEPNKKPAEEDQVETKRSRPTVNYRSSMLC